MVKRMPDPPREDDPDPPAEAWPARARQWSRAAFGLALVFGSLPLAGKLLLGSWGFEGAPGIAALCLVAAAYLHLEGRTARPPIPDASLILSEAIRLAASGETDQAIALLDEEFRRSPKLWQAREYRGQIHLAESAAGESALEDFTEAIRLAPAEPHLYLLRSHVYTLLGRDDAAQADIATAARLSGDIPQASTDHH